MRSNMADIELNEEGDAFLPHGSRRRQVGRDSVFIRYLPKSIRTVLKTLSTIKLMILLLATFLVLLGLSAAWNRSARRFIAIAIPPESIALSKELAKNLSGTAIPAFALTYAPFVFLDKNDAYFPSDLAAHIANTHPTMNFTSIDGAPSNLTLDNLDQLNALGREDVYLASIEPLISFPPYMVGQKPDAKTLQTTGAVSCAIIVAEKADGVVDVFYMYFYSFNDGPSALGHKAGNHLGDWEHNMVRFVDGTPQAVWFSQHDYGTAISYAAVHKIGKRPVAFSAKGSHANYLTGEAHDLSHSNVEIPAHVAYDYTSQGPLWDPALSAYYYTSNSTTNQTLFTPVLLGTPVSYLYFQGRWGDNQYPDEAQGQEQFHGFRKWTGGPQGPLFKFLDRESVCWGTERECVVEDVIR